MVAVEKSFERHFEGVWTDFGISRVDLGLTKAALGDHGKVHKSAKRSTRLPGPAKSGRPGRQRRAEPLSGLKVDGDGGPYWGTGWWWGGVVVKVLFT